MTRQNHLDIAKQVFEIESQAIDNLVMLLDEQFELAVDAILKSR